MPNKLMMKDYKISHNESVGRFEIELEGGENAVLVYIISQGLFVFTHTEVPPAFEGRGIAAKMAKTALDYARQKGFRVRSYCSYISLYIERHPEYQDLLD
jgi:hypothetical protein